MSASHTSQASHSTEKHSINAGSAHFGGASQSTDLVALLRDSIMNLNSKFDKFNETVTCKIETIEKNYANLNAKIDSLSTASRVSVPTFGGA